MNPSATPEEVAWAAGLFEGEGSIELWQASSKARSYPRACLSSTDEDVVRKWNRIVGGGKVLGPYARPNHPSHKPMWRAVRVGKSAEAVLAAFAPYLGERRTARMNEVLEQATGGGGRWPS